MFNWGLASRFTGLVYYHHGREHGGIPVARPIAEGYILFQRQKDRDRERRAFKYISLWGPYANHHTCEETNVG